MSCTIFLPDEGKEENDKDGMKLLNSFKAGKYSVLF